MGALLLAPAVCEQRLLDGRYFADVYPDLLGAPCPDRALTAAVGPSDRAREFGHRYAHARARQAAIAAAYAAAVGRAVRRQRDRVEARLAAIRQSLLVAQPPLAAAHAPVLHAVPPAPHLRASEVFMGGFGEDLADDLGGQIRDHSGLLAGLLLGGAAVVAAPALARLMEAQTARLGYVGDALGERVDATLADAYGSGLDFDAMVEKVGGLFDAAAGWLADRVGGDEAVTSVNGTAVLASQWGSLEGVERVWVSQRDERVRASHVDADNGEPHGLDEPFEVGEDLLMFPGDPDGSPGETISCRCYLEFVTAEGEPLLSDPAVDDEAILLDMEQNAAAFAAAATSVETFEFNPDQPRDEQGRWVGEGGQAETPAERGARVNEAITAAVAAGHTTEDLYEHGWGGVPKAWSPERLRLHEAIINDRIAAAAHVPRDREALMTGGLPGAGKTEIIETHHVDVDPADYLRVDPDEIKAEIYARGGLPKDDPMLAGLKDNEMASIVHEESSKISQDLVTTATREGINVLWDRTMAGTRSTTGAVDRLHEAGYKVRGVFIDTTIDHSLESAQARYERKADTPAGGRYIPPSVIHEMADPTWGSVNRATFEQIKGTFDSWQLWRNEGAHQFQLVASKP